MIINQAKNLFDVHCDGCGESQTFQGVYNKSQLADAIKTEGWIYKWTEDKEKFRHFCRSCVDKNKVAKDKEIRDRLIMNLKLMADPEECFFYKTDDPDGWIKVINQALEIIEKEKS